MIVLLRLFLHILVSPFKAQAGLEAEISVLRHQLNVLRGASVVVDALRTHPAVIVGGVLQENPFFVPPDQFLLEIRERR
jgi:hypothetical protein